MADEILIVDDEPAILASLSGVLRDEGYSVSTVSSGEDALIKIQQSRPDLLILDIWMSGMDGIAVLEKLKQAEPSLPVIMMSGHGSIETAVKATKLGAYDYIEKPLSLEKVVLLVRHALDHKRLQEENLSLKQVVERRFLMVGESLVMRRLRDKIRTAGASNARVLISGENGTGKELVARAIHEHSPRRDRPFVEINCAAIPDTLIESELFGYERGAFTGATASRPGRFEHADGATLFLDEIGDMSLSTQAKLLRVLQEQQFHRVGGSRAISVDVRVIAASNKSLQDEIQSGRFREDLFYRLNVIPLHVPPLRERKEDIPLLIRHFLKAFSEEQGLKPKSIDDDVLSLLTQYDWPGNVRELRNFVERLMIMTPHPVITKNDVILLMEDAFPPDHAVHVGDAAPRGLREARSAFERDFILASLVRHNWNVTRASEELGIERTHLYRKMKYLGIEPPSAA